MYSIRLPRNLTNSSLTPEQIEIKYIFVQRQGRNVLSLHGVRSSAARVTFFKHTLEYLPVLIEMW